jgi:hypothetical protein
MNFSKPRPGITFKNGKLYVFSRYRVSVLKGWPEMAAWTRSSSRPQWQRFRPVIDIANEKIGNTRPQHRSPTAIRWRPQRAEDVAWRLARARIEEPWEAIVPAPAHVHDEASAYTEKEIWDFELRINTEVQDTLIFIGTIPEQVRDVVARFPTRHWHLASMVARCDSTLQLLQENPGLGYAMASCWVFSSAQSGEAMRWIRRMAPRRRRDIAEALGFTQCEAAVRVLAKLKPDSCSVINLLLLRDLMNCPDARKILAHALFIDNTLLTLMSFEPLRAAVSAKFISQIAGGKILPTISDMVPGMLFDYLRMHKRHGIKEERRFQNIESLAVAHDKLTQRVLEKVYSEMKDIKFSAPPVLGCDGIIPISNGAELCEESREQWNCVASRAWDIFDGKLYVYRMVKPERATIALRQKNGIWTLDEVAAAGNQPVSKQAHMAIADWLGIDIPF